ncbi:putative ubiquitin-conjugating enzyme E2 38 [Rosa chinensis]|uniref:putative ubiquitin-conjugating enzyme E2 38 n=1 Tax=Rosa chinensis TaxID=74649 RepID=UPI000D091657|nr:putative ubiquitin-conjugating enzyme E2 38 [Rosa chinensis]
MASVNTKPSFKQFDVVMDHSDHQYSDSKCRFIDSTVYKKITREWRILEKDLPETIYVRTYETRVDLLRAVIVGAEGTPYEGGLFFFDIKFPDNYPNEPPKVHYRSHGLRLNPNLYETGYVCLSLLNTWFGPGWDSSQSTILQVLVSIQALVLNDKPYFNEPGTGFFNRWFGMKDESQIYSGDAFISTCKSTLYLLRNPPKNFEAFTADHFRGRASGILRACKAYAKVGYYSKETEASPSSVYLVKHSRKFKESMEQLYPQLVEAFKKNEASRKNNPVKEFTSRKNNPVKELMAERSSTKFADQVKKKAKPAFTPGRLLSAAFLASVAFVVVVVCRK